MIIIYFVLFFFSGMSSAVPATTAIENGKKTLKKNIQLTQDAQTVAELLFNPVIAGQKTPQPNPYSINSLNQKAVEETFGAQGMNLPANIVRYLQNFYFYFEYVVRIECAGRLATIALSQGIDFTTAIEKTSWPTLVNQLIEKLGSWQKLEDLIFDKKTEPNWNLLRSVFQLGHWKNMTSTPFWKSMPINQKTLIRSTTWQRFLKYCITHSFMLDQNNLVNVKKTEETMFGYLPNWEVAYYDETFVNLRSSSDMLHLTLLLNQNARNRWLSTTTDWNTSPLHSQVAAYPLTQDFEKTPYYRALAIGDNPEQAYQLISQKKSPLTLQEAQADPHLMDQLIVVAMIKNLQALMNMLTDKEHLATTLGVLGNNQIKKPEPLFLPYDPSDSVYLEDLANLHNNFVQAITAAQNTTPPPDSSAHTQFAGNLWDDAKTVGGATLDTAKNLSKDILNKVEDTGKSIAKEAEALGFGTATSLLVSLGKKKAEELLQTSKKLLDRVKAIASTSVNALTHEKSAVSNEFTRQRDEVRRAVGAAMNFSTHTVGIVKGALDSAANWTGGIITKDCNLTLDPSGGDGVSDTQLCDAAGKGFETFADAGINALAMDADAIVTVAGGAVRLGVDAVYTIANLAADAVRGDFSALGPDALAGLSTMALDAAATVLQVVTFDIQFFMEQLITVFKLVSYLISILTRIFIDIVTAVTYMFAGALQALGAPVSASGWTSSVSTTLDAYQGTIGAVITTALLLATIPLTGGASTGMVILGLVTIVGPQLFGIYGSYQQDKLNVERKEDEEDYVEKYQIYVNQNHSVYQNQQATFSAEFSEKYSAEVSNQQRGLGFAQNRMANNFETIKEQISLLVGDYWSMLLTPNTDPKIVPGDVGSIYGISTNVLDLNPSQGFALYNKARNSFSQEIAVAPALISSAQQNAPLKNKDWFNQTQFCPLSTAASSAHIRLRTIYTLNSFKIGLYQGSDLSLATVQRQKTAPIDPAHLAKMVIFSKDAETSPTTFTAYEHEGKGWFTTLTGPSFELGTWYHIKTQLSGSTLKIKVWTESTTEPSDWQTIEVTITKAKTTSAAGSPSSNTVPFSIKTIGVIASGAAIEYDILDPKMTVNPITTLRPPDHYCPISAAPCTQSSQFAPLTLETDRETREQNKFKFLQAPTISPTLHLQADNNVDLLKGNYVYTSQTTGLTLQNNPQKDYLALAEWTSGSFGPPSMMPGSLGQSPAQSNPQAQTMAVSLISQKVYHCDSSNPTQDGQQSARYCTGATETYLQKRLSLSPEVASTINQARSTYLKQMETVSFGTFTLQAASSQDLANNLYIYTIPLLSPTGTPLQDAQGKPVKDFVLCTLLTNNNISAGTYGLDPDYVLANKEFTPGLCSLVSGNIFAQASTSPVNSGAALITNNLLKQYQSAYGTISAPVLASINAATIIYNAQTASAAASVTAQNSSGSSTVVSSGDVSTAQAPTSQATLPPPPGPAQASLNQLSQDASADDGSF